MCMYISNCGGEPIMTIICYMFKIYNFIIIHLNNRHFLSSYYNNSFTLHDVLALEGSIIVVKMRIM